MGGSHEKCLRGLLQDNNKDNIDLNTDIIHRGLLILTDFVRFTICLKFYGNTAGRNEQMLKEVNGI